LATDYFLRINRFSKRACDK